MCYDIRKGTPIEVYMETYFFHNFINIPLILFIVSESYKDITIVVFAKFHGNPFMVTIVFFSRHVLRFHTALSQFKNVNLCVFCS